MQLANCPTCKKPLTFLDAHLSEQAFWQITPRFFIAPVQAEPMLLITLTMALSLAFYSHIVITALASILVLILVSNYGLQMLKNNACGKTGAPGISTIFSGKSARQASGITFLLGVAMMSTGFIHYVFGTIPSVIIAALWLWLLPALLMHCAADSNIKHAFRPDALAQIMMNMNWAYAGLVGYLLMAVLSTLIISDFALQHLPPIFTPLMMAAAFSYFGLALFGMFGHAMQQLPSLRSSLDPSDKNNPPAPSATHITDHIKRLDADIDIALKRGDYATAVTLLEGDLQRHGFSDLRHDQLFKLLTALKDFERLEHFSQLFLRLMVGRGQITAAADFVRQLKERNPQFKLYDLDLSNDLAARFHKTGEHRLVIWLAKDAHIRFDPSPELAALYLRAAKTLLEKFGQKNKARSYLNYIIKNLPALPEAKAAKILDQHIQKRRSIE